MCSKSLHFIAPSPQLEQAQQGVDAQISEAKKSVGLFSTYGVQGIASCTQYCSKILLNAIY